MTTKNDAPKSPMQRMSDAYATGQAGKQRERLAATFQRNDQYEYLLQHPELLAKMSINVRMSVGSYQRAKAAYEEVHRDENS